MEPVIISKYIEHQNIDAHEGITVKEKGIVIDKENPVLAASVDGEVTYPTNKYHPVGNIEAKYKLFPSKLKETGEYKTSSIIKNSCKAHQEFLLGDYRVRTPTKTKTFILYTSSGGYGNN